MSEQQPPDIPGAASVVSWFGWWPSFRHAQVIEVQLNTRGLSWLKVHAWNETRDGKHNLVPEKHALVNFELQGIVDLRLEGFDGGNPISGLEVERQANVFRLTLKPRAGISGYVEASRIRVGVSPGKPRDK